MARIARVVVPKLPHHIVQRGNRRQKVFFTETDYDAYLSLAAEWCREFKVEIWAYCLMPNHVHLIAVPAHADSLARAIGEVHRRYTRMINFREKWRGFLWQGRFASYPMEERYLYAAARYIEMNPVHAGLAQNPEDYPWSSARAHLSGQDDKLIKAQSLLGMVEDWNLYLHEKEDATDLDLIRKHERTGRPLGGKKFIRRIESKLGRILRLSQPGPKPKRSKYRGR
jgi:putative transposase